mmetsp:Transcript_37240/g.54584  ORF Transcript_37240/g.54584 Transcript_37240/m.54584 type:complete len:224 (-) Transcript_37240:723-1394(-)
MFRWNKERRNERDKIRMLTSESQAVLKAALSGEYDARARFLERAARAKAAGASAPSLRSIAAGGMGSAEAEDPQGAQFFDNQGVAALKEMYGKTEGDGARQEARRRREAHRAAHQRREVEYLASARGPRARYELGKARGALLREKKQLLTSLHGLVAEEERLLRALPPPSTGGSSRLTYSTWRSTTRSAAPGGGGGGGGGGARGRLPRGPGGRGPGDAHLGLV